MSEETERPDEQSQAEERAAVMGRPRVHDRAAVMEAICARLSAGELVKDAAAAEGVDARSVREWGISEEFGPLYTRARIAQCHALAEQILDIADGTGTATARLAAMVQALEGVEDSDKEKLLNSLQAAAVQRDKLSVDTRKWFVSKIAPKLYGDRLELVGNSDQPVEVRVRYSSE